MECDYDVDGDDNIKTSTECQHWSSWPSYFSYGRRMTIMIIIATLKKHLLIKKQIIYKKLLTINRFREISLFKILKCCKLILKQSFGQTFCYYENCNGILYSYITLRYLVRSLREDQ